MTELTAQLECWNFFGECLLHDISLIRFGYGLELAFNYVWDQSGLQVRADILGDPLIVRLRLLGVERVAFKGALTKGMLSEPEAIGWGLSEVARVEEFGASSSKFGLSVLWEGLRRLDVEFADFELLPPADVS